MYSIRSTLFIMSVSMKRSSSKSHNVFNILSISKLCNVPEESIILSGVVYRHI